jgi:hypothetical protein
MEQNHKDFLVEHINNWETTQSGYMRNVDMPILKMYEHIYRTYLDKNFVLTHWCSQCKMDMVSRLYRHYESLPVENHKIEYKGIEITIEPKKRGRPSKK